jgi:hypothetical protein
MIFYSSRRKAFSVWKKNFCLTILGSDKARRLPIFSFIVYHQDSGKLLHHNYVSTLLNDLYGIQARGGCACAGPYALVNTLSILVIYLCDVTSCTFGVQNTMYTLKTWWLYDMTSFPVGFSEHAKHDSLSINLTSFYERHFLHMEINIFWLL